MFKALAIGAVVALCVAYPMLVLPADPITVWIGVLYGVLCFGCGVLFSRKSEK